MNNYFEHIHGGNLDRASIKYGIPKERLIDFSANINPLGPSRQIISAVVNNLKYINNYPDPECRELKSTLASYLGIDQEYLVMGNGAAELIYLLVRVIGCKKALIAAPTFSEYGLAVMSNCGEVKEILMDEKDNFKLPVGKIIDNLPGADIIFLCNPNNPTGRVVHINTITRILDHARQYGVMVVVDEAFMDFLFHKELFSLVPLVPKWENIAVIYSMTKFFGIPGLRLGAIAVPVKLAARMNSLKDPWNVNILAQAAGVAGLNDINYIEETKRLVLKEKKYLFKKLKAFNVIQPIPGAANFILVNVSGSGLQSGYLTEQLGKNGIMVRDCDGFTGLAGRYIRIAVKTRGENEILLDVLKAVLEGK